MKIFGVSFFDMGGIIANTFSSPSGSHIEILKALLCDLILIYESDSPEKSCCLRKHICASPAACIRIDILAVHFASFESRLNALMH